jgi:amino acid permease
MLGILLIYFIWKRFAELAEGYNHKKWVFGLLGVVTYYAGTIIAVLILVLLVLVFDFDIDFDNTLLMSFIGLPFGILACYLLHYFLKKKWEKEIIVTDSIEDIGKITE